MASLQSILSPISQSQYVQQLLTQLQAAGVPTDQFKDSTQIDYAFTQVICQALADDRLSISQIESSVFLQYASGNGLTLFAQSAYQINRLLASPTIGTIRLVSALGSPSYTFLPSDITVGTQGSDASITKLYTNTTGGTLAPGSTLDLTFIAVSPGSSYNIPNSTALVLKTSFAGVSVSNPIFPPETTWIITQGTDTESDARLKLRCTSRWGTLGAGGNEDAYTFWALQPVNGGTTSPVLHVRVVSNFFGLLVKPAYTTVYVTGPNGPLSNSDLAAVQANFENPQKYPAGFQVLVVNAVDSVVQITGTVYVFRKSNVSLANVQAAVEASLLDYQGTLDIGDQTIYPQKIITWIMSYPALMGNVENNISSIRNIDLTTPNSLVNLDYNEYPRLAYTAGNLNYVLV